MEHDLGVSPFHCPACRAERSRTVPVEEYGFICANELDLDEPYWPNRDVLPDPRPVAGPFYTTQEVMEPVTVEHYRLLVRRGDEPVAEVGEDDEGRWWVKNGHHRIAAYREEGRDSLCEIWE